jgi:hypothetical protein
MADSRIVSSSGNSANPKSRGAYIDEKGVRWDTNFGHFEDWFSKKSKWMGFRRRRLFILKNNKIFFSKSDTDTPHGVIDLVSTNAVEEATEAEGASSSSSSCSSSCTLEIRNKDQTFSLEADDRDTMLKWLHELKKRI